MYPFDPTRPTLKELKERGIEVFDPWAAHSNRRDMMSHRAARSIDVPLPGRSEKERIP